MYVTNLLRRLQLLRQWTASLTVLLGLRSLLLLIKLNLLLVQLLARSQIEVVDYVRNVGHAVAGLRALRKLAALVMLLLLLVLEVSLDLRYLRAAILALAVLSRHEAFTVETLSEPLLLVAVDEAGAHLLTLSRIQSTRTLEALVVGHAILTASHLRHVYVSRVLRRDAAGVLVAQVDICRVTLVQLLQVLRRQVLLSRLLHLIRVGLQPWVDQRLLHIERLLLAVLRSLSFRLLRLVLLLQLRLSGIKAGVVNLVSGARRYSTLRGHLTIVVG